MSSTIETGHPKNVANFETLISFCKGYNNSYNPTKESLKLTNLDTQLSEAKDVLQVVKTHKTAFDNATNTRQLAFTDLKMLSTRIINALAASGANSLTISDAKTINRKMQGIRAGSTAPASATPGTEPTDKTISTSQLSYDSRIDHFAKLIELVSQEPSYTPNERELQMDSLIAKMQSLKSGNAIVINAYTIWSNTRILRSTVLYNPVTGLVQTAMEIKKYIKSVFGAASPQYNQVNGLEFKTRK